MSLFMELNLLKVAIMNIQLNFVMKTKIQFRSVKQNFHLLILILFVFKGLLNVGVNCTTDLFHRSIVCIKTDKPKWNETFRV